MERELVQYKGLDQKDVSPDTVAVCALSWPYRRELARKGHWFRAKLPLQA